MGLKISFKDILSVAVIATTAYFTGGATLAYQTAMVFSASLVVSRLFTKKPPSPVDNGVRQQIPPATVNSLPVVYGDAYLGGVFVDACLSQDQKVMYYVLAISSVSPNGQFSFNTNDFYYGDRLITFDSTDETKVISLTDGNDNVDTKINNKLFINLYVSDEVGNITSLNGASSPDVVMGYSETDKKTVPSDLAWNLANRKMYGTAFAIVKLVYNAEAGTTSLSPVTFYAQHYLNNQGCAKAGDVWVDYMTNPVYGGSTNLIDTASATALNAYGDELITFTNNLDEPTTQPRYRINGVIDTGTNVLENVNKILMACDSWMTYQSDLGKWSIIINKPSTPSLTFNDDNIIGNIKVSCIDINQSVNQIEAKFPNKLNKDIPDYVYIKTPTELLFPNEPVNKYSISFDLVNDSVQSQYLANRILEQAREDLIVSFVTTYEGIQANAGDVVAVTNSTYGWTNKLFRVVRVNESSLPDGSLGASLELNEYNSQVYDDKDITEFQPSPNSFLPDIGFFGTLTQPTVTDQLPNSAVPNFAVECLLPTLGQITNVSLYYTNSSTPTETDWFLWSTQTTTTSSPYTNNSYLKFIHINLPTDTYYFAFRVGNDVAVSELSPISSGYTWLPNPSSSAVAGTFIASFSPPTLAVPYSGTTPTFTGLNPQLYGTTAGGSEDFVPAQTDSDVSFVNNSWRIGASDTSGYGDIVASGITIGNPTDGGFYANFPAPTAMPSNPATLTVPVRYKAFDGTVYQGATAILQFAYAIQGQQGDAGASGNKNATATLYQWATSQPANPNGSSIFVWANATNTSYSGGNGWTTTIPANPSTPSIKLWTATKSVVDVATATSSTVDWSTGFSIQSVSQNGANGISGLQTARAVVYQWASTIPSSPTGTSTYTWASGTFTPTPSGWTLTPSASPSVGFTLWEAGVSLVDSATVSTSTINWTTSTIGAVGYAGTNGTNGATGATGATGASSRVMYSRIAGSPVPSVGTVTVGGDNRPSGSQASAIWGGSFNVIWYANDPNPSSNDTLWQSDGIYTPTANQTAWSTPYISNLKVGSLSAITVNTGGLNVTDFVKAGSSPAVSGSSMSGSGFTLNSGGTFAIGNSSKNMSFNGSTLTMNGDIVVTGNVVNNAITETFYENDGLTDVNSGNPTIICTLPNIPNPAPFQSAFLFWSSFRMVNTRTSKSEYFIQMRKTVGGGPYRAWVIDVPASSENLVAFSYFDEAPVFPNSYTLVITAQNPSTADQYSQAGSLICTVLKK
jgi:hypothetical protein